MIRHFADDVTRILYEQGRRKGWGEPLCRVAIRKLMQLNGAQG